MRRSDYAQDDAWIGRFLSEVEAGYVATRWDEIPFITPVTFWYDPERHRVVFHTNITGRLRTNAQRHAPACFAAARHGRLLPSNAALEFSIQYESVVAFGDLEIVEDPADQREALYGLIARYFPGMAAGEHYRPIQAEELARTSVFSMNIERWSGKRNWKERADQIEEWPPLPEELLNGPP